MRGSDIRRWRPRFALGNLLLFVLFLASLGALYYRPQVWVLERPEPIGEYEFMKRVPSTQYLLIWPRSDTVQLWDILEWRRIWTKTYNEGVFDPYYQMKLTLTDKNKYHIFEYIHIFNEENNWQGEYSTYEYDLETLTILSSQRRIGVFDGTLVLGNRFLRDNGVPSQPGGVRFQPIRLFDLTDGSVLHEFKGTFSVISPSDMFLFSWDEYPSEGGIKAYLYEMQTGNLVKQWLFSEGCRSAEFYGTRELLVVDHQGTVRLFEIPTCQEMGIFHHSSKEMEAVHLSDDANHLITSGRTSILWDIPSGRRIAEWPGRTIFMSSSPDGSRLLIRELLRDDEYPNSIENPRLRILDSRNGESLFVFSNVWRSEYHAYFVTNDMICMENAKSNPEAKDLKALLTTTYDLQRWSRKRSEWGHLDLRIWAAVGTGLALIVNVLWGLVRRKKAASRT